MTTRFAGVNGVSIAYSLRGKGPPLVLVMGYRLNSTAWPAASSRRLGECTMGAGTQSSASPLVVHGFVKNVHQLDNASQ
jgi:pimeloyl-ACP methyl ester carboxylesterase